MNSEKKEVMPSHSRILTINKPEKGRYSQNELEKTKVVLEAYSKKYPEDVDYWLLDPRGIIDVSATKEKKAFFLAEFKHYEQRRKAGTIRVKWTELLACKAGGIPLFAWIETEGKEWFIHISPDAIPYTIVELEAEAEILTSKGNPRRTQISFFDNTVGKREIREGFEVMNIVTTPEAIELLKREVEKHS